MFFSHNRPTNVFLCQKYRISLPHTKVTTFMFHRAKINIEITLNKSHNNLLKYLSVTGPLSSSSIIYEISN
jgi:hypothetical protein